MSSEGETFLKVFLTEDMLETSGGNKSMILLGGGFFLLVDIFLAYVMRGPIEKNN